MRAGGYVLTSGSLPIPIAMLITRFAHPADRASKCTIDAIVPAGACAYSCRQACTSATSAGYALQARPAILDVREPPTAS